MDFKPGLDNWMRNNQERTQSTPLHTAIKFLNKQTRHIEALTHAARVAAESLPVASNVVTLRDYLGRKPRHALIMPNQAPQRKQ